jgi:D-glycero-D-manno-heptose 1,7-bisphosphate phosphatase
MLEEIGRRFNSPLQGVPAIGDALRDLEAAAAVGAQPMLVLTGKGQRTHETGGLPEGTLVFTDLAAAAKQVLQPS